MRVFHVALNSISQPKNVREFVNFLTAHESVESLTAALNSGIVTGTKLHTRRDTTRIERSFFVTSRAPCSLSASAIYEIKELTVPLYDENGTALHADKRHLQDRHPVPALVHSAG